MTSRPPDMTPDPAVLDQLREARDAARAKESPAEPPQREPVAEHDGMSPILVHVGTATIAPMLDAQAQRLFNAMARTYVASNVHASTALYVLELLRSTILLKEGRRLGVPGFAAPVAPAHGRAE